MFSNIGAVGAASAGDGSGNTNANPYGPAGNNPMPSHFRRHGNAERYGGSMGITPPGTPPRSRQNSPRSQSRRRRIDDDEPPARREQRERSRDREESRDEASGNTAPTSMPTEWGARTLRVEKQLQDNTGEIAKMQVLIVQLQSTVDQMNTRSMNDHNRLNALEGAIPERVHRCEERQAYHVEILNGFARNATEQIASLQHRVNGLEEQQQVPNFGGGQGGNPATTAQHFNIGSPISEPFSEYRAYCCASNSAQYPEF